MVQVEYHVESDEAGGVILVCQHANEGHLYPEEVSAQVLAYLLDQAQTYLKASISKAVISVSFKLHLNTVCYNVFGMTLVEHNLSGTSIDTSVDILLCLPCEEHDTTSRPSLFG